MTEQLKRQVFCIPDNKLGVGEVQYCWQPGCRWLALVGETKVIIIVDRLGKTIVEFQLKSNGKVLYMEFDADGDTLALFQKNSSIVTIINIHSKKVFDMEIERNNKDRPTAIKWGKKDNILAVCTQLGLIYMYNKISAKLIPCALTHSSSIFTCDWNNNGYVVTGSSDKTISVTGKTGNALLTGTKLKEEPKMIKWAKLTNDNNPDNTTISTVLAGRIILIYDTVKKNNPVELSLKDEYGSIITYEWFGNGYIAIAFSKGNVCIVSTHSKEIQSEIASFHSFKTGVSDISICEEVNRIAVAGENMVKIYDTNTYIEFAEEKIEIPFNAGRISKIEWSTSGHILIISTLIGYLYAFNVVTNEVYAISKNNFATLTSLNEVNVSAITKEKVSRLYGVTLADEPKSIAISEKFFVANFGLYIQIYQRAELMKSENNETTGPVKFVKRNFTSNVNNISLNSESMAVLSEGRVYFLRMDGESEKIFPLKDTDDVINQATLTEEFLIYSDSTNRLRTFQITQSNSSCVAEYKFEHPIKKIFANELGTKVIVINSYGKAFYYSPIIEKAIALPNESEFNNIIWDTQDQNLFIAMTTSNLLYVFYVFEDSLEGTQVNMMKEYTRIEDFTTTSKEQLCVLKLEPNNIPFYLTNGFLYFFQKNTKEIKGSILLSHYWIYNWRDENDTEDGHKKYFMQNFQLGRFANCCKSAAYLEQKNIYYNHLGKHCLNYLEIDISEEAFRRGGNISLTLTVEKLRYESEKKILLGHIAAILGKEDKAEQLFVNSTIPSLAVDLRCDLQDWNLALKLANDYQPYRIVFISKKLAYKFESENNAAEAIKSYEKSKISNIIAFLAQLENDISNTSHRNCDYKDLDDHNIQCDAGISRCCFRLGDTTKAMNLAEKISDKQSVIEIAYLAESLNYSMEAAKLFSKVGMYEKAATIYIAIKQFKFAEDLIDKIKSTNLLIQLARMKENEKLYKDAEKAYERAGEWEHVIRLNLKYLNNVDKAKDIVLTKHKTEAAALLVAEHFESLGRKKETIEFKLIAKRYDEAFALAQTFNEMDAYAEFISKYVKNQDEFKKIAIYYEGKNLHGKSGIYYEKANNTHKALQMYIKSGADEYLERAVEMVGLCNEDELTNKLIDHLLINNVESGPHFLIKLYIFLGNFSKACEIGIELSIQEQQLSNYKNAHKILWDLYMLLKEKNLPVSYDCNHRLAVLHSYMLAKNRLIKSKMFVSAARNFLRVGNNIQMFEKHIVEILTNLVLICNEAKLTKSASEWAFTLFDNPKYKDRLHANFKDQIAKIASKAYKNQEEALEIKSPCPFCKTDIPEYSLTCVNCYNVIPFCIASGKHVTTFDLYSCPECNFPAIGSELKAVLQNNNACPMCAKGIDVQLLEPVKDVVSYFKSRRIAKVEDKKKEDNNEKIK